jgi:hypothetical protein
MSRTKPNIPPGWPAKHHTQQVAVQRHAGAIGEPNRETHLLDGSS